MKLFKPSEYVVENEIAYSKITTLFVKKNIIYLAIEEKDLSLTFLNENGFLEMWFKHTGLLEQTYIEIE